MLKKLLENSSIIYSEIKRVNLNNKKELCLISCSEQMSSFIKVETIDDEVIPISDIEFYVHNVQINWIDIFEKVLKTSKEIVFEYDCYTMNRYMQVKVFSPEEEHLIVLFNDITDQIEVATFSETLAGMSGEHIDFAMINDYIRNISGASFSILNLFEADTKSIVTKSISGDKKIINNVISHMGIKLIGHEWNIGVAILDKISDERITRFKSFRLFAKDLLPEKLIDVVEATGNIGEVYVVTIIKGNLPIGDITFLMKKGSLFRRKRLIEGIASQIGMVIEQRRTNKELYRSKEMFQSVFQQAPFGIAIVDLNNHKSYNINQRYCEITGRDKKELLTVDWKDITHPDDIKIDLEYTQDIMNGDFSKRSIEKRYLKPDGTYIWAELSIVPIYGVDNIVTHHIIMNNDITYRKKMAARNEYLSYHDELTGLYNRHFYEAELKRLDASRNLPLSIVFADVNGLKISNDAYGHNSGDILLKRIGHILKTECRKGEIVARVGGDEFIILLPQTGEKQAEAIIKRLHKILEKTSINNMMLSVSFGIAVKNNEKETVKDLIIHAEQEMYKSKLLVSQDVKSQIFNKMLKSLHEIGEDEKWHSLVIGELAELMARKLGFADTKIKEIKVFGAIHDIGKVGIKASTIRSSDKLNKQEWLDIKRHSEIGYQIVCSVNEYASLADSVLSHHERWDGKGYPNGLKGKAIPIYSRILAIIDAYEVMTGKRDYNKNVLSKEEAIQELEKYSGKQFDPELVGIFAEVIIDYNDPRI